MKTFSIIKNKIYNYRNEIDLLNKTIQQETEKLKKEIHSYWKETNFISVKSNGKYCYYYLSSINGDEFNGIKIDNIGNICCGTININLLIYADEYETITPNVFFSKLKSVGKNLDDINNPIAYECNKFKPKVIKEEYKKQIVGYCRLSNNSNCKNMFSRQINIINTFANNIDNNVCEFFTEIISGTVNSKQRTVMTDMIEYCKINNITTVIISEINRLGRMKNIVLSTISHLFKNGIKEIYSIKENILINEEFLINNNRKLNAIAQSCQDEYESIRYRMKEGYMTYVENRKKLINNGETNVPKLGRQGYMKDKQSYAEQYQKEIDLLQKNISIRQINIITGTATGTLMKLKKMFNIVKSKKS